MALEDIPLSTVLEQLEVEAEVTVEDSPLGVGTFEKKMELL